jgi:hypothetical protein
MSEVQQLGLFDISIYTMEVIDDHDVLESSKIQVRSTKKMIYPAIMR